MEIAKRAQVVLSRMWAERMAETPITFHSMHPGWAETPGVVTALPRFYKITKPLLRTPEQGADTVVWLAVAAKPALTSGKFWFDRQQRSTHFGKKTRERPEDRQALWERVMGLARLDDTVLAAVA